MIVVGDRVLDGGRPAGKVVGCQQAAMAPPRNVQHVGRTKKFVDRLGDEAAIPRVTRRIDAGLACIADSFLADALIGRGQYGAGEQRFRRRHFATG